MRSGGVERGTIEIAEAIRDQGWRAIVASSGGAMADELMRKKIEHVVLPLKAKNPFKMWRNIGKLTQLIKQEHIDIVHARSRAPAWSAYLAAKRAGVPFITTFHGTYNQQSVLKRWYNSVMVRGTRIIAISRFIETHMQKYYAPNPAKIRLIPRGADLSKFDSKKINPLQMQALAESWAVGDDHPPLILLPGRITRWKGQHIFIEALAKLPHRNWMAVIMGDDKGHSKYREELRALIKEFSLDEHIRFAPNTPHMPEAYALSHMVVSASTDPEAFGRIPVEAQAMGKPIVATNHGGATETVLDGISGFLVKPDDADAMATAMQDALELTLEKRDAMVTAGYNHVLKHYSTKQMQTKTIAVYQEVLDERS